MSLQALHDLHHRPLRNLRLSVTDRCNLRCQYCMPEEEYTWLSRSDLLSFEELSRLVDAFMACGADRVRLTGGEPLIRRGLDALVGLLAGKPGLKDLALTTNGILLAGQAERLRKAGLQRITVSLDTLRPSRFHTLTRRDNLHAVLDGIAATREAFGGLKFNTVVMRGVNDDELVDLVEYGREVQGEVRFIEYMDVGGATRWSRKTVVTQAQILETLSEHFGQAVPLEKEDSAPADRFRLPDGTVFGIISSTTAPFCESCDRSRVTADGMWYHCLYAKTGRDLRQSLRSGASQEALQEVIRDGWAQRTDRGAEERLRLRKERAPLVQLGDLRRDPHLEMHTRGG